MDGNQKPNSINSLEFKFPKSKHSTLSTLSVWQTIKWLLLLWNIWTLKHQQDLRKGTRMIWSVRLQVSSKQSTSPQLKHLLLELRQEKGFHLLRLNSTTTTLKTNQLKYSKTIQSLSKQFSKLLKQLVKCWLTIAETKSFAGLDYKFASQEMWMDLRFKTTPVLKDQLPVFMSITVSMVLNTHATMNAKLSTSLMVLWNSTNLCLDQRRECIFQAIKESQISKLSSTTTESPCFIIYFVWYAFYFAYFSFSFWLITI